MAVVYVHGIGNRDRDLYETGAAHRDGLFRRFLLPTVFASPADVRVLSPYWGEHGAAAAWDFASFPSAGQERLGSGEELTDLLPYGFALPPSTADDVLVDVARRSLSDAVDLLYTVMADDKGDDALLDFAVHAVAFCAYHESLRPRAPEPVRHPWLATVQDDLALVDQLHAEVVAWADERSGRTDRDIEHLGGGGGARDRLAEGVGRLRAAQLARLTSPVADGIRRLVGSYISLLIGDVMTYLAHRGTVERPGPVIELVGDALADAASRADEPLVVVAHSMGGNIVYDVVSHYRPDLWIDVLVTVGAQVGYFEELKLFRSSRTDIPGPALPKVPCPENVGRWINVVDRADILAYRISPVFDGVEDYQYPTGAARGAHSAYFGQPRFHARLAERVRAALS